MVVRRSPHRTPSSLTDFLKKARRFVALPKRLTTRVFLTAVGSVVLTTLVLFSVLLPSTRATVATFYFSSCLGGWENASLATGESSLAENISEIGRDNSALLRQSTQPLFCGKVEAEPIPNSQVEHARVHLLLNFKEKNKVKVEVNSEYITPEGTLSPEVSATEGKTNQDSNQTTNETPSDTESTPEQPAGEPSQETSDADQTTAETSNNIDVPEEQSEAEPKQSEPASESAPTEGGEQSHIPRSVHFGFTTVAFAEEATTEESEPAETIPSDNEQPESNAGEESPVPEKSQEEQLNEETVVTPTVSEEEPINEESESTFPDVSDATPEDPTDSASENVTAAIIPVITGPASDEDEEFLEVLYTFDGTTWVSLGKIGRKNWKDAAYDIPISSWEELDSLQVSVQGFRVVDNQPDVYLESMPIEITYGTLDEFAGIPEEELEGLPTVELDAKEVFQTEQRDFMLGETIELEINPYIELSEPSEDTEQNTETQNATTSGSSSPPVSAMLETAHRALIQPTPESARTPRAYRFWPQVPVAEAATQKRGILISAKVSDAVNKTTKIRPIVDESGDSISITIPKQGRSMKPGEYQVKIRMLVRGTIVESTEQFTLGVLGLNVRRGIMTPDEVTYLQLSALDRHGHTLCNANLELAITDTQTNEVTTLSTDDGSIIRQSSCGYNNYTDLPDYTAEYIPESEGTYSVTFLNRDTGYSITDSLQAEEDVPYIIERRGASRLNPFLNTPYGMQITIAADEAFEGEIVETVPAGFNIIESPLFNTRRTVTGDTEIVWQANLTQGASTTLAYEYSSPAVSPMLYLLGPIKMYATSSRALLFSDEREWRLASDAACVSNGSGDWNSIGWTNCASGPQSGDTVTISEGHAVTLGADKTIAGLTICDTDCRGDTTLTHNNSTIDLTINGTVTVNGGSRANINGVWNIGAGTATVSGSISYDPSTTNAGRDAAITISTGTLNANGNIAFENTAGMEDNQMLAITSTGQVNLAGALTNPTAGDIQPGTASTFNYNGSAATQSVVFDSTGSTYANLLFNNTHASGATISEAITTTNVTGDVRVQSGLATTTFDITGTSGEVFEVSNGASFKTTSGVPTGFTAYTFGASSNFYLNVNGTVSNLPAYTYGNLFFEPTLTATNAYTGLGFTVQGNWTINPTASAAYSLGYGFLANVTVSGTTTITGSGSGPATSALDLRPVATDYNLTTRTLDIQTNGTLDGTSAASTITTSCGTTGSTCFTRAGNFIAGNTTVQMTGDANVTLTSGTFTGSNAFHNLLLAPNVTTSDKTYTFGSGAVSTNGYFTINPLDVAGARGLTVGLGAALDVTGTTTIMVNDTFPAAHAILDVRPGSTDYNLTSGYLGIQVGGTLDATGAASTITLDGTAGTLFTNAGTFTAGSSEVIMNPDADVTLTSGTFTGANSFYKLTLSPLLGDIFGATYVFGAGAIETDGDFAIIPSALSTANPLTVELNGSFTVASTATTTISGQATGVSTLQTTVGNVPLSTGKLDIATAGTLTANASTITLTGTSSTLFTRAGTFTQGTSEVKVTSATGNPTFLSGATTFHKLTIDSAATVVNMGSAVTINNVSGAALNITNGVFNVDANNISGPGSGNGTFTISSTGTLCLGGTTGATTATCDSGTTQTSTRDMPTFQTYAFNAASTVSYLSDVNQFVSDVPDYGKLRLVPKITSSHYYTIFGTTAIAGNFDILPSATSNICLNVDQVGAVTVAATATTTVSGTGSGPAKGCLDVESLTTGHLDIATNGEVTSNAGSDFFLTGTNGTLFTRTGSFTAGTSMVTMNTDANVILTSGSFTGSNAFYELTVSPTVTDNRTYTFGSGAIETNEDFLINMSGDYVVGVNMGANITVAQSATTTITRATGSGEARLVTRPDSTDYNLSTGGLQIDAGGRLYAAGSASAIRVYKDWVNDGTFTQGNTTVYFAGIGDQDILDSTTWYNLTATTSAARAITFTAGTTQTIATGGALVATGTTGQLLTLQSSSASSDWYLSIPSGSSRTVDYTAAIDANASNDDIEATNSTCTRTTNWSCAGAPSAPTITNLSLNGGQDIVLIEGTFKWATASMLITDTGGCSEITGGSVSAKLYLASSTNSGTLCNQNDLNCYTNIACTATTTGNTCAADNDVEYDCGFKMWYISTPTDTGSLWASSVWSVSATATDSTALTGQATNTANTSGIDVVSLISQDISPPTLNYGSVQPAGDTGASNVSVDITNTGNTPQDVELSGEDMVFGAHIILPAFQEYLGSAFTYGGGIDLTTSATRLEIALPSPTATTSAVQATTYWGIGVPAGRPAGTYTGTNHFDAVLD